MYKWEKRDVPGNPLVGIGVATYLTEDPRRLDALRCLVASFQAQTYPNWKLRLGHDGPVTGAEATAVIRGLEVCDKRVLCYERPERQQQFGHPHRQFVLDCLIALGCKWLLLTNDDNYYAPTFLEWLLFTGEHTPDCDLVFCDCVHSHHYWRTLVTEMRRGKIDLGCVLVKADLVKKVKFDDYSFAGDWSWLASLAARSRGPVQKVPAALFTHN